MNDRNIRSTLSPEGMMGKLTLKDDAAEFDDFRILLRMEFS
ncbi:hypothetical protein [Oleispirillum naphthae]